MQMLPLITAVWSVRCPLDVYSTADNQNNAVCKMQLDCICWKLYFCETDKFISNTKDLIVVPVSRKYWNNINGTKKTIKYHHELWILVL